MNTITRILVPIDFLPHSAEAVRRAVDIASRYEAALTLLHIYQPAAYPLSPGDIVYDRSALERASAKVRARLDAVRRELDPAVRRRVDVRVLQGTPARAIIEAASDERCDLIVMGTHGRTGVDRLMSGSIAEDVVRRAPCPVLTIKTPAKTATGLLRRRSLVEPLAGQPGVSEPARANPASIHYSVASTSAVDRERARQADVREHGSPKRRTDGAESS